MLVLIPSSCCMTCTYTYGIEIALLGYRGGLVRLCACWGLLIKNKQIIVTYFLLIDYIQILLYLDLIVASYSLILREKQLNKWKVSNKWMNFLKSSVSKQNEHWKISSEYRYDTIQDKWHEKNWKMSSFGLHLCAKSAENNEILQKSWFCALLKPSIGEKMIWLLD
jgi:hypothetical protein